MNIAFLYKINEQKSYELNEKDLEEVKNNLLEIKHNIEINNFDGFKNLKKEVKENHLSHYLKEDKSNRNNLYNYLHLPSLSFKRIEYSAVFCNHYIIFFIFQEDQKNFYRDFILQRKKKIHDIFN